MTDPDTAIMLAQADARILSESAAPLLHRLAFLRTYQREAGEMSDVGRLSLSQARSDLYALLRAT